MEGCKKEDFIATLVTREMQQFKVVVLGDAGVGKTSLLYRFRFGVMPQGGYEATIGVEFFTHAVHDRESGAEVARLHLWDTAGHESFRSFTSNFLRGAAAALVCFDLGAPAGSRGSPAGGPRWCGEVRHAAPGAEVMIVGLKSDLCAAPQKGEAAKAAVPPPELASLVQGQAESDDGAALYRETSARTGQGVAALFDDLTQLLLRRRKGRQDVGDASSLVQLERPADSFRQREGCGDHACPNTNPCAC